MLDAQFRDHLGDDVIKVRTVGHILQQRAIPVAKAFPVVPVHVLHIEVVPIPAPHFVEDLGPFLGRHPVYSEAGRRDRFLGTATGRRRIEQLVDLGAG
jgi:hypothetical protein